MRGDYREQTAAAKPQRRHQLIMCTCKTAFRRYGSTSTNNVHQQTDACESKLVEPDWEKRRLSSGKRKRTVRSYYALRSPKVADKGFRTQAARQRQDWRRSLRQRVVVQQAVAYRPDHQFLLALHPQLVLDTIQGVPNCHSADCPGGSDLGV